MARRQFSDVNVNFPLHLRHFPPISTTLRGNRLKYRRCIPLKNMLGHHFVQKQQMESTSTMKVFCLFKFSKIPLRPVIDQRDRAIACTWQIVELKQRLYLVDKIAWIASQTTHDYELCSVPIISFKQDLSSSMSESLNLFLWDVRVTLSRVQFPMIIIMTIELQVVYYVF